MRSIGEVTRFGTVVICRFDPCHPDNQIVVKLMTTMKEKLRVPLKGRGSGTLLIYNYYYTVELAQLAERLVVT